MQYLVRADDGAQMKATLVRHDTGAVVDWTDAIVVLKVREKNTTTTLFTLTGIEASEGDYELGVVTFLFVENLDTLEGYYQGEISITYASTQVESVYELVNFQVRQDFT